MKTQNLDDGLTVESTRWISIDGSSINAKPPAYDLFFIILIIGVGIVTGLALISDLDKR